MALKFDFNKLRSAIATFTTGTDVSNGSLSAGEEAKFTPHMRIARPVEAITNAAAVARTLTTVESGTLFTVNMATADNNVTITLPSAGTSAGVYYDFCFLVDCDDDADFILKTSAAAEDFYGYQIRGAANSTLLDIPGTASTLTLDANVGQDIEGMRWSVLCDGANWHYSGYNTTAVGTANTTLATGV
jgi:hypothetical protein